MRKTIVLKQAAVLALAMLSCVLNSSAQKGSAFGLNGGYYMSNLWNEDDALSDQRLDYVSTMKYGGGVEYMGWIGKNFGLGIQGQYLQKGQSYAGRDTFSTYRYDIQSTLNYGQVSLLAYHRSFNKYKPEARFRFVSYFGPYVGFLAGYRKDFQTYFADGKLLGSTYYDGTGVKRTGNDTSIITLKGQLYKNYDIGFVMAPGFEVMIAPTVAITFNARLDIGSRQIENRKNLRQVIKVPPYEESFFYWNNVWAASFNNVPSENIEPVNGQYYERARTTSFTAGAFLGLRFYTAPIYFKSKKRF